jgi:hypothetical protein
MNKFVMVESSALPDAPKKDSKHYLALVDGYKQLLDDANATDNEKERRGVDLMMIGYELALYRIGFDINHVEVK